MVLGRGFVHGIVNGAVTPDETLEDAVIRWERVIEQSQYVLGPLFGLVEPISNELFKVRVRADYRLWFRENRELIWDSAETTLMDLATEAKAYEERFGGAPRARRGFAA